MKIARVTAECFTIPVELPLIDNALRRPVVLAKVETSDGVVGHGLASGNPDMVFATREFLTRDIAPFVTGMDPLQTERVWHGLLKRFNNRHLTGVWSWGVSALDLALWDVKGKVLGRPVSELLGGYSDRVRAYVTFGVAQYTIDELCSVAQSLVADGHRALKMVVGGFAEDDFIADKRPTVRSGLVQVRHDAERVRAVREAVGPDVDLIIDANYVFPIQDAKALCRLVEDCDLLWFEEPVKGNDPALLRHLRESTTVPIGAGQNLGHPWSHRELISGGAVDLAMPNVCFVGGFTGALKVAHLAEAFQLQLAHGGGWPFHNMHLHAGVPNGGPVEFHWSFWKTSEALFDGGPTVDGESVVLSDRPGLGFEPRDDLEEFRLDA